MKISKVLALTFDSQRIRTRRFKALIIWLVCSLVLLALSVSVSSAQNYKSLEIHPDYIFPQSADFTEAKAYRDAYRTVKARHSESRSAVTDAIKSGSPNFGADGDKYMLQYRLASMTQTSDAYLSRLGSFRTDFLKLYMGSRASANIRRTVIGKVLPELEKIALDDQFHPAVRVNAVSMIGLLDQQAGDSGTPPVPSAAAYASLKKIWADRTAGEAVRASALSGIRRFAEISRRGERDESSVGDFKGQAIAILKGSSPGQDDWQPDFDYWMKRRATQILGFIGTGNDVVDAIVAVMKEETKPGEHNNFWLRFDGLQALANLRFDQLDRAKITPLIDDVLGFLADILETEAATLERQVDELVYTNILWGDYDLEDEKGRRPRGGSVSGRGGGRGDDDGGITGLGGGGDGAAGLGGGGGGDRGGDRGRGGNGRGNGGVPGVEEELPYKVELPVFMMNNSRSRLKAIIVTAIRFFDEPRATRGIIEVADNQAKSKIADEIVGEALQSLIKRTEIGVIDYRSRELPAKQNVTDGMVTICREGAEQLRKLMTNPPKQEAVAAPGSIDDLNQ